MPRKILLGVRERARQDAQRWDMLREPQPRDRRVREILRGKMDTTFRSWELEEENWKQRGEMPN